MGKLLMMQPTLIHVAATKDIVYTPKWIAKDMVDYFKPSGVCLDPCLGGGVFYKLLPSGSSWCEIEQGVDFYAWNKKVDWIIGNPPYSHLLAWIRHSFKVAKNIVYLIPAHRVFSSFEFLEDMLNWGGIPEVRLYGTGTVAGFAFGNALAAVYYKARYQGKTKWSRYKNAP